MKQLLKNRQNRVANLQEQSEAVEKNGSDPTQNSKLNQKLHISLESEPEIQNLEKQEKMKNPQKLESTTPKSMAVLGRKSLKTSGNPTSFMNMMKSMTSQPSLGSQSYFGSLINSAKDKNGGEFDVQKKLKKRFKDKIQRIDRLSEDFEIEYPFLIIPQKSKAKLYWDTFMMFYILYIALTLPWEIAFPEDQSSVMTFVTLAVFIMDICVNLRTTYYNQEFEEIVQWKAVALNYVKSFIFVIDLVSTFPFESIQSSSQTSGQNRSISFQILQMLKIIRLFRLGKLLGQLSQNESVKYSQEILKYFLTYLLMLHWFSLLWLGLVTRQSPNELDRTQFNTWIPTSMRIISDSSFLDENERTKVFYTTGYPKLDKYLYTYYSILMLMQGGETTPVNQSQSLIASIIVFLGQISIAIIFANMGAIIVKMGLKQQKQESYQDSLQKLFIQYKIPAFMRKKAEEYFQYCWRKNLIFDKDYQDFSQLSQNLQKEIRLQIHKNIIQNVPLFSELELYEILAIIQKLKTRVYMPEEYIYKEGELVGEMFFVEEGVISMTKYIYDREHEEYILSKGDHLGEMALLTHWRANMNARCRIFCNLQVFQKKDFEQLKYEYPDMEKRLKQGIRTYKDENIDEVTNQLKKLPHFLGLTTEQLQILYTQYMQDIFSDPETIVIGPKEKLNGIYYIQRGQLNVFEELNNGDSVKDSQDVLTTCVDDNIYDMLDINSINQQLIKLKLHTKHIGKLSSGQIFGCLPNSDGQNTSNDNKYIICETACHFQVITFNILCEIMQNNPGMYSILERNLRQTNQLIPQAIENYMKNEMLERIEMDSAMQPDNFQRKMFREQTFKNPDPKGQQKEEIQKKMQKCVALMEKNIRQIQMFQQRLQRANPGF